MKHLFYLLTIAPILWELANVVEPNKFYKKLRSYKNSKWDDYDSSMKAASVLLLLYALWAFVGLFTAQWASFATIFILSFLPKKYLIIRFIDSVITSAILFFIIINSYHLHINTGKIVIDLIKSHL